MRIRAEGAYALYFVLLSTDFLGGEWKRDSWLDSTVGGSDGNYQKITFPKAMLSRDILKAKYDEGNQQARLLLSLILSHAAGDFDKVRSMVAENRGLPNRSQGGDPKAPRTPYESLSSYFDWFDTASASRKGSSSAQELEQISSFGLDAARRLDRREVEVVTDVFVAATQFVSRL